ncbi:hypothetical protein LPJ72_004428 [Coemansia sp. Benny D160-2]|nr:hypothetical protein LPJ72_004428 [Coemansia sp. Benny D160-2]
MHSLLRQLLAALAAILVLAAGAPVPQSEPTASASLADVAVTPKADGGDSGSGGVSSTQIYYILALSACAAGFVGFVITLALRRRRRRQMLAAGASYGSSEGGRGLFGHMASPRNPQQQQQRPSHHEKSVLSEEQFNLLPHTVVEKGARPSRQLSISAPSLLSRKLSRASKASVEKKEQGEEEPESCTICLCEYVVGEKVVNLVPCNHMFHSECAFRWLTQKSTSCPLCKADMLEGLGLKRPKSASADSSDTPDSSSNVLVVSDANTDANADASSADESSAQQLTANTHRSSQPDQAPVPPAMAHVRQHNQPEDNFDSVMQRT